MVSEGKAQLLARYEQREQELRRAAAGAKAEARRCREEAKSNGGLYAELCAVVAGRNGGMKEEEEEELRRRLGLLERNKERAEALAAKALKEVKRLREEGEVREERFRERKRVLEERVRAVAAEVGQSRERDNEGRVVVMKEGKGKGEREEGAAALRWRKRVDAAEAKRREEVSVCAGCSGWRHHRAADRRLVCSAEMITLTYKTTPLLVKPLCPTPIEPREQMEALQRRLNAAEAALREQEPALTAFHVRPAPWTHTHGIASSSPSCV